MSIIDTHAHLDHLANLDQAIANAKNAKVSAIAAMSMDLASCRRNLEIKKTTDGLRIFLAMGIHPAEVRMEELEPCLDLVRGNREELSAIGEIGLDFWYKAVRKDKQKHEEQRQVFRAFLELAKELDLPVVIHARGTWRECLETTKNIGIQKVVFHWYSGPLDILKDIIASNYFISASPALAHSPQLREVMSHAPMEQILIETDCPVFFKNSDEDPGFIAEPKDVWRTLKAYCELKKISQQDALTVLNQNAKDFFGIEAFR